MCWFESGQGHHNNFKYIERHFATGRRSLLPFSKCCSKSWPGPADALLKERDEGSTSRLSTAVVSLRACQDWVMPDL